MVQLFNIGFSDKLFSCIHSHGKLINHRLKKISFGSCANLMVVVLGDLTIHTFQWKLELDYLTIPILRKKLGQFIK